MRRSASPAWSRALSITLLIAVSILDVVDSKKIHIRRQNNNAKIFICKFHYCVRMELATSWQLNHSFYYISDIGFVVFLFCLFFVAGWCAREFCPRGPIFTPLELDEIRLDRLDDIESSLKTSISTLKVHNLWCVRAISLMLFLILYIIFTPRPGQARVPSKEEDSSADRS